MNIGSWHGGDREPAGRVPLRAGGGNLRRYIDWLPQVRMVRVVGTRLPVRWARAGLAGLQLEIKYRCLTTFVHTAREIINGR